MISAGEIQKGMMVTVLNWSDQHNHSIWGAESIVKDKSYIGDQLEIIGISLPFIRVKRGKSNENITLDTRDLTLMELSEDFIK